MIAKKSTYRDFNCIKLHSNLRIYKENPGNPLVESHVFTFALKWIMWPLTAWLICPLSVMWCDMNNGENYIV